MAFTLEVTGPWLHVCLLNQRMPVYQNKVDKLRVCTSNCLLRDAVNFRACKAPRWICSASGDGFEKVQQIIGRVNKEDKKIGFGPPPPVDTDGGAGFINLTGLDDIMTGKREFNTMRRPPISQPSVSGAPSPDPANPDISVAQGDRAQDSNTAREKAVELAERGALLATELTATQTIVALGLLGVTILAFAEGSHEVLPQNVLFFLQGWMGIAWVSHAAMGVVAAIIAQRNKLPPSKWFFKVVGTGALGLQELLKLIS